MIEKLWLAVLTVCLAGCAGGGDYDRPGKRASAPLFFLNNAPPSAGETYLAHEENVFRPMGALNLAEEHDRQEWLRAGYDYEPALPANCSLKDRFDREAALAYNFSDRQSRLALNIDGDAGFGGFDLDKVMVTFKYKLQAIPHKKDACRYRSGFQGLIGSGYNEFFRREKNTVWQELRDIPAVSALID